MIKIKWKSFIYDRQWLGWWRASYCSAHFNHDANCPACQGGSWCRSPINKWTIVRKLSDVRMDIDDD